MKIRHLKHSEINLQEWDNCVQNAVNSLVYAESWFLNIVSPNWGALVADDYEFVMPLPVKRKYGVSFLVQPPLTQQLGVFSSHQIDGNIVEEFIKKIPYRSYHLNFNEQNSCTKVVKRTNFLLDLNRDYEILFAKYSNNTKRNIKKAQQYHIEIKEDVPVNDFLEFYHSIEKNYKELPQTKLDNLVLESLRRCKATIYGAYNQNGKLISALFLLHSHQRLIYLLPVSNQEGKEVLVMFKMVDNIIQKHSNTNCLLDFAGSNVKNIARFYDGFGTSLHFYNEVKHWSINDFIKRFYFCK